MTRIRSLSARLARRRDGWNATARRENDTRLRRPPEEGRRLRAMIIAGRDSRVDAASMLGDDAGGRRGPRGSGQNRFVPV